jgi:fumarylacetoacetate (FAA) hydrolase
MKLGSLSDGSRDGALLIVSKDLQRAVRAVDIAPTLLAALESWSELSPRLEALYRSLNSGTAKNAFDLDQSVLAAPLPRTWQWLDASAFHSHGDLMEKVFKLQPIEGKHTRPLMYQGGSDDLLGAHADLPFPSEKDGIDFEAEVAVITDRVPMQTSAAQALAHIKLLMLANDASLRVLAPVEMKTGFGWIQAKPSTSFSPVAVTPDELGTAWRNARVCLPVQVEWNGKPFGHPDAGEMGFGFDQLIAHAAYSRNLSAGTVIGSGTISNSTYRSVGSACIAERRGIEVVDHGAASTPYMKFGDRVRIEMFDTQGNSIFGAIDQKVVQGPSGEKS